MLQRYRRPCARHHTIGEGVSSACCWSVDAAERVEVSGGHFSFERGAIEIALIRPKEVSALVNHTSVVTEEADEAVTREGERPIHTGGITVIVVIEERLTETAFDRTIGDRKSIGCRAVVAGFPSGFRNGLYGDAVRRSVGSKLNGAGAKPLSCLRFEYSISP